MRYAAGMVRLLAILLVVTAACTPQGDDTGATDSTAASGGTTASTGASAGTDATAGTTGVTGTTAPTGTTEATGTTAPTGTTGSSGSYCQGFESDAVSKFLTLEIVGGEPLTDGVVWPLECGGQGSWMFGIYPSLGGWDPMNDVVTFTIEVDVEGHNTNPAGHFFSGEVSYYIGCEQVDGGVVGVAPVFPPDDLADLSVLDGLPAQVHVTVPADGEVLTADAAVMLSAPKALVDMGCMFL